MEKFFTVTGKTIQLAMEAADAKLLELHIDPDTASRDVTKNPKSGFLGIGAQLAEVKVTYEGPAESAAPALSSASRSKPKSAVKPAAPKPEPPRPQAPKAETAKTEAPKAGTPKTDAQKPARTGKQPQQPRRTDRNTPVQADRPPRKPVPVREYAPSEPGSTEEKIELFLKGLLEKMGSPAVPHAWKAEADTYDVDLVGENLGILIGRRGETLDAIQHLTNYVVNRGGGKRIRVNVDAENYRAKREDALRHLANKVAGKVVKFRRNITLEPMNAYERHIIHAALQDTPDVSTYSTGTEPNRRVVVAYGKTTALKYTQAEPKSEEDNL